MDERTASGEVYETSSGRSTVYRHGTCTVNHRSHGAAASCTKSAPSGTSHVASATVGDGHSQIELASADKQAVIWGSTTLVVGLLAGFVILLADPIHFAAKDAATRPCPTTVPTSNSSAGAAVPDVVGQNGEVAEKRLKDMGLVAGLESANSNYKSVWVTSNWTVISTDPAPGCSVSHGQTITVYVTK